MRQVLLTGVTPMAKQNMPDTTAFANNFLSS